jgi:hypothetical protein
MVKDDGDRVMRPRLARCASRLQTPNSKQFKPTKDILPNTQLGEILALRTGDEFLA